MTVSEWAAYGRCLVCGVRAGARCQSRRANPARRVRPVVINRPHAGRPHRTRQETR